MQAYADRGKSEGEPRSGRLRSTVLILLPVLMLCGILWPFVPDAGAGGITSLRVEIRTCDKAWAGTDNTVTLYLTVDGQGELSWHLDTPDHNDFERGNTDVFNLSGFYIEHACKIRTIRINKSEDNWNGGWKLGGVNISGNGSTIYSKSNVNQWLENDSRDWWPSEYLPPECPPPPTPPAPPVCKARLSVCHELYPGEKDVELIDSDCDGIPDLCDPEDTPLADDDHDGIPNVFEDPNGDGAITNCESDPNNPDSDGDGILDGDEDSDGDGLPDWFEDPNRNCIVDVGESDPNNSDTNGDGTSDGQQDSDGDGTLDPLEVAYGTDPNNPDTDGDGWFDGPRNRVTTVYLSEVKCIQVQENSAWDVLDGFDDELFVTFNHTRWPDDKGLDGTWEIGSSSSITLNIEAARRVWSPRMTAAPVYSVRTDVREDDWFDWTDDDLMLDTDIPFSLANEVIKQSVDNDDYKYEITLRAITSWFADPHPLSPDYDSDRDGLSEKEEFTAAISVNGVADLTTPDIYMELDWQAGQQPERFSKEDIASRFAYHGYLFHLDDDTFGGGGKVSPIGDVGDGVSLDGPSPSLNDYRDRYFDAAGRQGIFRYALAVENVKDAYGWSTAILKDYTGRNLCGRGDKLVFEDCDFLNYFTDMESIVWLHEFGHNLGLCHLPGDNGAIVTGPGGDGGCTCCESECNCTHYSNGRWSESAMGAGVSFPYVDDIYQAIDREINFDEVEWKVIDLTPIDGVRPPINCP